MDIKGFAGMGFYIRRVEGDEGGGWGESERMERELQLAPEDGGSCVGARQRTEARAPLRASDRSYGKRRVVSTALTPW